MASTAVPEAAVLEAAPSAPLRYRLARLTFAAARVRTLSRVRRIFREVPAPCLVERPLFGYTMRLDVSRSLYHQLLYLEGERLISERHMLAQMLRPGMTVVDVGANIGYYLLMFERLLGETGHVYCIEPSAENLVELEANLALNGFRNVTVLPVAIGAEDGETRMSGGVYSRVFEKATTGSPVPIRRLDSVVDGKVDFLKIDVDGYEGQVLRGAEGVLRRDRPILFLEVHPHRIHRYGVSVHDLAGLVRDIYPSVEIYEYRPQAGSAARRVAERYRRRASIMRVADQDAYLASQDTPDGYEFWIVGR